MSWHNDDDDVENDSVGWFNARDYEEPAQPSGYPETPKSAVNPNDPFARMERPRYRRRHTR